MTPGFQMLKKAFAYIDAENNYIRTKEFLTQLTKDRDAVDIFGGLRSTPYGKQFPREFADSTIIYRPQLQMFWDCVLLSDQGELLNFGMQIKKAIHACSISGDADAVHSARSAIRKLQFEPLVIEELKDLKARRQNQLNDGVLDKAKGCDIALACRMLEDGFKQLYDCCILFTSDADFAPAVDAIQRLGLEVWVYGYEMYLPKNSVYQFKPERFIDLGARFSSLYENAKHAYQLERDRRRQATTGNRDGEDS